MQRSSRDMTLVADAAHSMADAAGKVTLPLFRQPLEVANKAGEREFDPVTEADKGAEKAIREVIQAQFPDDGILGEEFGSIPGVSGYQWILDPIDGTRAFITGVPQWGTLIALHDGHQAVFGLMDQPFLKERYLGYAGSAQWMVAGGALEPLQVRSCECLQSATLMTTCPDLFKGQKQRVFQNVREQVSMTRYGGDCYSYCLLAAGFCDLIIETDLNSYDIQALIPIIEGAGGIVSDWSGGAVPAGGDVIAAASKEVHTQALALLKSAT